MRKKIAKPLASIAQFALPFIPGIGPIASMALSAGLGGITGGVKGAIGGLASGAIGGGSSAGVGAANQTLVHLDDVRAEIMKVGGLPGSRHWGKQFFDTAEAGVDDFLAEATPETKLKLIREIQAEGKEARGRRDRYKDRKSVV